MITLTWEIVGPLVASGLLIFLARINPELAARISAWAGSSPAERDLDISQIDYWAYQEAERFVRENPMQPTEGMSFGKPWAREVAPWEYADQGVLTVEELTEQFVVEGRRMRDPCKYLGERWGNVVWQERTPDRDKERRALEQAYEILCAPKFEKLLKMAELSDQVTNLLMKVDAAALGVILARLLVVDPDLGSRVGEAVRSGTLQDLDLTEMEFWKLRNVVEEAEVESQSTAGALTSSAASVVRLFGAARDSGVKSGREACLERLRMALDTIDSGRSQAGDVAEYDRRLGTLRKSIEFFLGPLDTCEKFEPQCVRAGCPWGLDGRYGDDVAVSAKKNVEIALRDIGGGAIDRAAAPSAEEVGLYRESFEEMVDADGERPAAEKRALLAGWDEAVRYVQTVVDWEGLKKARPYAHTGRRNLPAWFYTESDDDLILGLLQQWIQSKVSGGISSAAPLVVGE